MDKIQFRFKLQPISRQCPTVFNASWFSTGMIMLPNVKKNILAFNWFSFLLTWIKMLPASACKQSTFKKRALVICFKNMVDFLFSAKILQQMLQDF